MSEIDLTGTAWTSEMRLGLGRDEVGEPAMEWRWKLRAEVSVTDALGRPRDSLSKSAWSVHVTDYNGLTQAPTFTVAKANVAG